MARPCIYTNFVVSNLACITDFNLSVIHAPLIAVKLCTHMYAANQILFFFIFSNLEILPIFLSIFLPICLIVCDVSGHGSLKRPFGAEASIFELETRMTAHSNRREK